MEAWKDWETHCKAKCSNVDGPNIKLYHKCGVRLCDNSPAMDVVKVANKLDSPCEKGDLYQGIELNGKKYGVVAANVDCLAISKESCEDKAAAVLIRPYKDYIIVCEMGDKSSARTLLPIADKVVNLLADNGF